MHMLTLVCMEDLATSSPISYTYVCMCVCVSPTRITALASPPKCHHLLPSSYSFFLFLAVSSFQYMWI